MAKRKRELIIEALLTLGCEEVECRSGKYRAFRKETLGGGVNPFHYFVGKSGALRRGKVPSDSMSITHYVPRLLRTAQKEREKK